MENSTKTDKEATLEQPTQASLGWVIILIVFSLSYLSLSLWILIDLWVRDKDFIAHALSIKKENLNDNLTFVMALYTVTGALMGNAVLDFVSYHKYWAVRRDFQASHIPGFFYGPWLAGTIGLIIFCLLQSGLFVFSGGAAQNVDIKETAVSKMGYISVGFLSGFGWMKAVEKIQEVVSRFFSTDAYKNSYEAKQLAVRESNENATQGDAQQGTQPNSPPRGGGES